MISTADEATIPLLIVEFAVVAQVGKVFCESTYALEGDDPLGSTCWMIFDRLDRYVNQGIFLSADTLKACDHAGELMTAHRSRFRTKMMDNVTHLQNKMQDETTSISNLQSRLVACNNVNNTRGGRKRRINYAALNSGTSAVDTEVNADRAEDVQAQLDTALKDKAKYEEELHSLSKELEDYNSNCGPTSTFDFQQHAKDRVKPVYDKHKSLYSSNYSRDASLGYPLYASKRAFNANKFFDII